MKAITDRLRKMLLAIRSWIRPPAPRRSNPLTVQRAETRKDAVISGAYDSLDTMMNCCDEKFEMLAQMKWPKFKGDAEVAQLARRIGTFVPSGKFEVLSDRVELAARPYFLALSFQSETEGFDEDDIHTGVVVIKKTDRNELVGSIELLPKSAALYIMGFGCPKESSRPSFWTTVAVLAVMPDGRIIEPRMKSETTIINSKVGGYVVCQWQKQRCLTKASWPEHFAICMNLAGWRDYHWSVNVTDGDNALSFSIPDNDAPRFFAKRPDKSSNIFHAVVAHHRTIANGSTTTVKTHYRGARKFSMRGYDVTIQMPGLHRNTLDKLPSPSPSGDVDLMPASDIFGGAMRL